jgi:hypothetical protein
VPTSNFNLVSTSTQVGSTHHDGAHYGIRSVPVAHIAESDDVLAWLAGALACHALVGVRGRRASDMGNGEKDDTVVVFAEAEIEGAGALVVGRPERAMERPSVGVGDGVVELKDSSFGPPTEWVTSGTEDTYP